MTQVFDPATLETDSIADEVAGMLEEMASRPSEGDELGDIGGIKVKASKMRSMVRYGDRELPARTRVYDKFGMPSDVPTAQLAAFLSKPRADSPGERAFFSKPPQGVARTPIDETCEWCAKRAGRNVKVFYDLDDYETHCEMFHPREWERKLRRENQTDSVTSVTGLLKLLASLSPEQRKELVGEA